MVRAIEDLGFDSVWLGEHLLYRWPDRPAARPVGGLDDAGGHRRDDHADRARAARRLHQLPQPGAARQAGRDDRRDQRRALRSSASARAGTRPSSGPSASRTTTGSTASRRRSRSSGRSCARAPSTSTGAGTRPATASSCRAARAPRGPPLMIGSNGPRMLRMTVPHVDSWNAWYADTDNRPDGVARAARPRRRGVPRGRPRSRRGRADGRRPRPPARRRGPAPGSTAPGRDRRPSRATRPRSPTSCAAFAREGIGHVQLVLDPITHRMRSGRSRRSLAELDRD